MICKWYHKGSEKVWFVLRGNCKRPHCFRRVAFMYTPPSESEKADQRCSFDILSARWDSAVLLGLCFSPASQGISQLLPKRPFCSNKIPLCTICWVITRGPGRPCWICNKLSQVGKEEKRLFPWHNLINTMHHSSGKPAVMWEGAFWQLSPDNYCLFGGLKWHGREKENFKISSNFIAHNVFCQHMLWQSKKSISPASFLG